MISDEISIPYPPGKVYDLAIKEIIHEDKRLTLSWTAPGSFNNLGRGNYSLYYMYQGGGSIYHLHCRLI